MPQYAVQIVCCAGQGNRVLANGNAWNAVGSSKQRFLDPVADFGYDWFGHTVVVVECVKIL